LTNIRDPVCITVFAWQSPTTALPAKPTYADRNTGCYEVNFNRGATRKAPGMRIELIWLTGRLMRDFKTIAGFRWDNGWRSLAEKKRE